jgi:hypothetical protein
MKKLFKSLFLITIISTLFIGNTFCTFAGVIQGNALGDLETLENYIVAHRSKTGYEEIKSIYNQSEEVADLEEGSPSGSITVKAKATGGSMEDLLSIEVYKTDTLEDEDEVLKPIYNTSEGTLYAKESDLEELNTTLETVKSTMERNNVKANDFTNFVGKLKAGTNELQEGVRNDINPTWQRGAAYMNNEGKGIKEGINLVLSVFMWFLWVGFLAFELINGACILFPIFRDKVTGDGTNIPWFLTVNTKQRLANMEEEPMKKWLTNEVGRIITFFLITIGIFSGVFYLLIQAVLNLLPG